MGMDPSDHDKLLQRYEALRRDFMDLAQALGVEPSFQAVAQEIADLATFRQRAVCRNCATPLVAPPSES